MLTTFTLTSVATRRIGLISATPETFARRHFSSSVDTTRHPPELTFNPKIEGSIPFGPPSKPMSLLVFKPTR